MAWWDGSTFSNSSSRSPSRKKTEKVEGKQIPKTLQLQEWRECRGWWLEVSGAQNRVVAMVPTIPCSVHHGRSWVEVRWSGGWKYPYRWACMHSIGTWQGKDKSPPGHMRVPAGSIGGFTFGGLRCYLYHLLCNSMVPLGVKVVSYKEVFPATSCFSAFTILCCNLYQIQAAWFCSPLSDKWHHEGLDGIFPLDRKMELVRGKVDVAFLGPFEGLWYVLHILEHKLCIVIGH